MVLIANLVLHNMYKHRKGKTQASKQEYNAEVKQHGQVLS